MAHEGPKRPTTVDDLAEMNETIYSGRLPRADLWLEQVRRGRPGIPVTPVAETRDELPVELEGGLRATEGWEKRFLDVGGDASEVPLIPKRNRFASWLQEAKDKFIFWLRSG
jgi:hypothetical protein